jgi:1-acyl-sn-glycerol-3-phosphate acyltransferase
VTKLEDGGALPVVRRPPETALAVVRALLAPWRWLTGPKFLGLENIPGGEPVLLAGNHTLEGMLDLPLMVLGLWEERQVFAHGMADHIHFQVPGWRDFLRSFGAVDGTRENCRTLMRARESILIYPGGAREVFKRKGEKYRLLWEGRTGFARLAIEHGYPIVPFAAVGAEECYDILVDAGDLLALPVIGDILRRFVPRVDVLPPLVRGAALSPLPRPERFYFWFGTPIETRPYHAHADDPAAHLAVRERVQRAVEGGIRRLLAERERDPDRDVLARFLHQRATARRGG